MSLWVRWELGHERLDTHPLSKIPGYATVTTSTVAMKVIFYICMMSTFFRNVCNVVLFASCCICEIRSLAEISEP